MWVYKKLFKVRLWSLHHCACQHVRALNPGNNRWVSKSWFIDKDIVPQHTRCGGITRINLTHLKDCGPSWVQRGRTKDNNINIVDRRNHSCPEPSWLGVKFRASPLNLRTPTNKKHIGLWPGPGDYRMSQKRECAFTIIMSMIKVDITCYVHYDSIIWFKLSFNSGNTQHDHQMPSVSFFETESELKLKCNGNISICMPYLLVYVLSWYSKYWGSSSHFRLKLSWWPHNLDFDAWSWKFCLCQGMHTL